MSKNYFKKTLAGIFAVAIVASSIPLAPYTKVLDSISITASAISSEVDSWSGLQTAIDEAEAGVETPIALAQNITASDGDTFIVIPADKVITLDLNGYTLDRGLSTAAKDGYVIRNNGTLTICDESEKQTGKITGGYCSNNGGGIYNSIGTLTINGGSITGNSAGTSGGGIYNYKSTLTINGGSITGNSSVKNGGGIYNYKNSTLTISGGSITGNTSSSAGSGIYNREATLTISGGSITGNTSSSGGGIYNNVGTLTISDGSITGNVGGGIYSYGGTLTINGGSITGNTTTSAGGGINNYLGTITINGGNISDNTAQSEGGGIYNGGTLTITGGNITGNSSATYGGGIFANTSGNITVGGSAIINGNLSTDSSDGIEESNIHLNVTSDGTQAKLQISETTPLTNSASIGITVWLASGWGENTDVSKYIDGLTADNAKQFFATNCGSANRGAIYYITAEDGKFVTTTEKPAAGNTIPNSTLTWEIDENGVMTISGDDTALPAFLDSEWNMTEWCGDRSKIKKVVFNTPNLTSIGRGAFYEFKNLESIELPNSLTMIGDDAFECCTSLKKIEFPNTLTTIGDSAFYGCEKLESIELPDSLTTLSWGAFGYCKALKSIKLSAAMTSIPEGTFMYAAIESFTIPAGITEIGDFAFGGCPNLKAINVEADNSNYCSVDGVLFNKDKTALMQYPIGKEDAAYTVPDTVTSILEGAFYYAESLTDITLPDSLKNIGEYAFAECPLLTDITIPASVTNVGEGVFGGSGLKSATFECDDADAIANFNPDEGRYIFNGCTDLETIYVPAGCADSYKNSDGYKAALGDYIDLIQEMPTAEAKGYSVSYNGDITINFHYLVSDSCKNGYIKFSDNTQVSASDAVKDANGYFVFPISMPAKNMYDEITAQFYDENDVAIGNAVTFDLETYMDKVKAYDPNYSDFVDSFLEYGKQAAAYFGVTGAPAGKTYSDSDFASISNTLEANYASTDNMGDTFVGATLLLKSTPKLRLYYSETFTGAEQNELNKNLFYTEKEISPVKFGTEDLNGYYVYNYIYKAMNSDDSGLKALCAALYNMSKAIPAVG